MTFEKLLAFFARAIVRKYKPKIVGITGSVGKTSAKEAIFAVVSQRYRAYRPLKNFNNEFGLPFAILGVDSPGRSAKKWLVIFAKAISLLLFKQRYPEILVLEYGVDHPGDMNNLLSIAVPDIAVITSIGASHYEFFKDVAAIELEKGKLIEALPASGTAILNADNDVTLRQMEKTKAAVVTYGINKLNSDTSANSVEQVFAEKVSTQFSVNYQNSSADSSPFIINAVGTTHLSAIVCAITVASVLKIDVDSVRKGVQNYRPTPGRLNVIGGIKRTTIIDDTYNSSPDSVREALVLLDKIPAPSKMAVIGDMLELGSISDNAHVEVGQAIAKLKLDHLITVGPGGKIIADSAKQSGMSEDKIISFANSDEAKPTVQQILKPESVVLIKGSQGMRMEKVTLEIMAEPMRAHELLCRQYGKWLES